ncbi:hypothetical protein EVAR_82371_1 [Eumeta japonica]|uniref:Uncharacterized protein n=1 Tax=Eumeta variegata TaxID=151549 RepID=A0A4C1UBA1_EUMVA|nr:hypothetical protein EVAR_82371_1 [Eumeta japonica]
MTTSDWTSGRSDTIRETGGLIKVALYRHIRLHRPTLLKCTPASENELVIQNENAWLMKALRDDHSSRQQWDRYGGRSRDWDRHPNWDDDGNRYQDLYNDLGRDQTNTKSECFKAQRLKTSQELLNDAQKLMARRDMRLQSSPDMSDYRPSIDRFQIQRDTTVQAVFYKTVKRNKGSKVHECVEKHCKKMYVFAPQPRLTLQRASAPRHS